MDFSFVNKKKNNESLKGKTSKDFNSAVITQCNFLCFCRDAFWQEIKILKINALLCLTTIEIIKKKYFEGNLQVASRDSLNF